MLNKITGKEIRGIILEQSKRAYVGHIGSGLCIADMVAALYGNILRATSPDDPERDRFILSKGHAALALYAALYLKGWISRESLDSYCGNDSLLGVHPVSELTGVDFSTGSLGHGMSLAVGAALAARLQGSPRRVFALISDAECNEGVVWEAAMFAAHHHLNNLIVMIDLNGQQAIGYTHEVINLENMAEKWRSFGWDAYEIDGHDPLSIIQLANTNNRRAGQPMVLVCRTIFGKGVSFMENRIEWHYLPMDEALYQQALKEVAALP
ncbi:MAG: transketolase [Magnetococcales bacterium]|nr:transketolase [Magnetococcales bacterium]